MQRAARRPAPRVSAPTAPVTRASAPCSAASVSGSTCAGSSGRVGGRVHGGGSRQPRAAWREWVRGEAERESGAGFNRGRVRSLCEGERRVARERIRAGQIERVDGRRGQRELAARNFAGARAR
jgi:hypothetical protein